MAADVDVNHSGSACVSSLVLHQRTPSCIPVHTPEYIGKRGRGHITIVMNEAVGEWAPEVRGADRPVRGDRCRWQRRLRATYGTCARAFGARS